MRQHKSQDIRLQEIVKNYVEVIKKAKEVAGKIKGLKSEERRESER